MISDDSTDTLQFNIREFLFSCNIFNDSGSNYSSIKYEMSNIAQHAVLVLTDDEHYINWIAFIQNIEKKGVIRIQLLKEALPYLVHMNKRYTFNELSYVLKMKSQYSIMFFDILMGYKNQPVIFFNLDDLKQTLYADNYIRFSEFRKYVLEVFVTEINDMSDYYIKYELTKLRGKFARIRFYIDRKLF